MYINCIECRTNSIPISNNVRYIYSFLSGGVRLTLNSILFQQFCWGADGQPGHWNPLAKSEIYQRASYCKENPFHRPKKISEASNLLDIRGDFMILFSVCFSPISSFGNSAQTRHQNTLLRLNRRTITT